MYGSNGYSKKLNEFIEAGKPAVRTLTVTQIQEATKVAGLVFITDGSLHPSFDRDDFLYAILSKWGPETVEISYQSRGFFGRTVCKSFPKEVGDIFFKPATIRWWSEIIDGEIWYTPHLSGYAMSSGNVSDRFCQALGLEKFKVEVPEKIVTLPLPQWAWANDGDGNQYVVDAFTTTMFASEAKTLVEDFRTVLSTF